MPQLRDEKNYFPQSQRLDVSFVEGSPDLELVWYAFSNIVGKTLTQIEASTANEVQCAKLKKLHEEILYAGRDVILHGLRRPIVNDIAKKLK